MAWMVLLTAGLALYALSLFIELIDMARSRRRAERG